MIDVAFFDTDGNPISR